jgi:cobalt transport protein ATP-binding subunit
VRLEGVRYSYAREGEPDVLRDVSLEVAEGQVVLVTGPTAAGKTTLCRCANGLIPHHYGGRLQGKVTVAGTYDSREYGVPALSKLVGVMFQEPATQLFAPTVEDELAFGPANYGVPLDEIARRRERLLDLTRLGRHRGRNPHQISGGEQQACALASILMMEPAVLVLDEPTSNIDPVGSRVLLELVARLAEEQGRTLVVVEHKLEELAHLADRLVVMQEGRVVHEGPVREVLERVEEIERLGVHVPQVTLLAARLRAAGWPIPHLPLDVPEAEAALRPLVEASRLAAAEPPPAPRPTGEVVVEVRGLEHRYPNGALALRGVDVQVRRNEFVAVLGQNGSGKTTLVKHLNGLLQPTAGEVRVLGRDAARTPVHELAAKVGLIFQDPNSQICKTRVFEEIAFGPRNLGLPAAEVEERAREAAARLDVDHLLDRNPFTISVGDKQRVAVAGVLAMRPSILVLDEPTTGQDLRRSKDIMDLARELHRSGTTVIVITHDMTLAAEYCDRVVLMIDGVKAADGPTREVFADRELLERASLRPPQVAELGLRLGAPAPWLTVEEALVAVSTARAV